MRRLLLMCGAARFWPKAAPQPARAATVGLFLRCSLDRRSFITDATAAIGG
jgi:hypothetical protein